MSNGEKKIAIGTWQAYIGEDDHGKLLLICTLCSKHFCISLLFRFFCSCCNFHAITRLKTLATQTNWFVKYIPCSPVLTITTYTSVSPPPLMNALSENTCTVRIIQLHFLFTVLTLQLVYTKQSKITLILDNSQIRELKCWWREQVQHEIFWYSFTCR